MAVAAVAVKDFSAVLMTVLMVRVVSATVLAGAPEALAAVAAVLAAILLPQLLQQCHQGLDRRPRPLPEQPQQLVYTKA